MATPPSPARSCAAAERTRTGRSRDQVGARRDGRSGHQFERRRVRQRPERNHRRSACGYPLILGVAGRAVVRRASPERDRDTHGLDRRCGRWAGAVVGERGRAAGRRLGGDTAAGRRAGRPYRLGHRRLDRSDVTGFIVLTRDSDVRRIPFWLDVAEPEAVERAGDHARQPGDRPPAPLSARLLASRATGTRPAARPIPAPSASTASPSRELQRTSAQSSCAGT